VLPSAVQLPNLIGGVYALDHSAAAPSSVELPLIAGGIGSAASPAAGGLRPTGLTPLGCPTATGRLHQASLGPVTLGLSRARARSAFATSATSSTRGHSNLEFFCLTPNGIRVGYPAPAVLGLLPRRQRVRARGTVVLALNANRHFALDGVRAGTRLARVARRLRVGTAFHVGRNRWYLTPGAGTRGVLKVQRRVIEEVGVAEARLTRTRADGDTFFRGFS